MTADRVQQGIGVPESSGSVPREPEISLVIATCNRSASLSALLDSLAVQTLPPDRWEAVVADNNSADDTAAVVARFAAGHPGLNVRRTVEPRPGVSYARNRGIEESRGRIIAVVDDDETVVPGFLESYALFFREHPEAAAAGGRVTAAYETEPPRWMSRYTARPIAGVLDSGQRLREFPEGRFFAGGNLAVRRSVLDKVGLFDTALGRTGEKWLSSEEKELYYRIKSAGGRIYYLPGADIYHHIPAARLTPEHLRRVSVMNGASERLRTLSRSRGAYAAKLLSEGFKWGATLAISAGWLLAGRRPAAAMLVRMRAWISRGLLGGRTS